MTYSEEIKNSSKMLSIAGDIR